MSQSTLPRNPETVGSTAQATAFFLMMGVVIPGCVLFLIGIGEANAPQPSMISLFAFGFAALNSVVRFVVPTIIVNRAKAGLKEASGADQMSQLAGLYQTKIIVGMALLEGAALFNLIAYSLERHLWSYGVVAFLLGVMAISFPSQGQFESWAEEMKRDLN